MQAGNTKRFATQGIIGAAIIGILATAAVVILALAMTRDAPSGRQSTSAPAAVPQLSADEAYTIESDLAFENLTRASAAARQITSDTAYVLEAEQLAQQQAAQARRLYLTPDEGYAIEQALMAEQARHIAAAGSMP